MRKETKESEPEVGSKPWLEARVAYLENERDKLKIELGKATKASAHNFELATEYGQAVRSQAYASAVLAACLEESKDAQLKKGFSSWTIAK